LYELPCAVNLPFTGSKFKINLPTSPPLALIEVSPKDPSGPR